jgi:hypothetical protein
LASAGPAGTQNETVCHEEPETIATHTHGWQEKKEIERDRVAQVTDT